MVGKHLTTELLEEMFRGRASSRDLVQLLFEHAIRDCRRCRETYEAFLSLQLQDPSPPYQATFNRAVERTASRRQELDKLRREAVHEFSLLVGLDTADRRARVFRATKRYRSPFLVDLLIGESRRRVTADPFEAYDLAELAQEVGLRIPHALFGSSWAMTAVARANAYRANALRAIGESRAAEPVLETAIDLFAQEGSGDPLIEAELMGLVASLRKDQRRFPEAEGLINEMVSRYLESGESLLAGRALVKKGELYRDMGQPTRAIAQAQEAISLIDPDSDPRLYLCAQHNLTHYLQEAERYEEALERLQATRPLYDRFPEPWTQLRFRWLSGKIGLGLGNLSSAERDLVAAHRGFIEERLPYDAALAGLDVALVYLLQSRAGEVKDLAERLVPIFQKRDIQREALAAFLLFQEAANREAATIAMVEELAASMERARTTSPRPC